MEKKEYWIDLPRNNNFKKVEKSIREFLLKNSDTLRLTRIMWGDSLFGLITFVNRNIGKQFGTDDDPKFIKFINRIQNDFIKKVTDNKRFNDIIQPKKQKWEHYFYKLSGKMKALINKETIFFNHLLSASSSNFYGFEDTTFYKKDKMIGCVISHERMVVLYLSDYEKSTLENKGITFIKS